MSVTPDDCKEKCPRYTGNASKAAVTYTVYPMIVNGDIHPYSALIAITISVQERTATMKHNKEHHLTLPALKSLGKLADVRPTVVIDSREQLPFVFTRLESVRSKLQTGDYSYLGGEELFAVERKTNQSSCESSL